MRYPVGMRERVLDLGTVTVTATPEERERWQGALQEAADRGEVFVMPAGVTPEGREGRTEWLRPRTPGEVEAVRRVVREWKAEAERARQREEWLEAWAATEGGVEARAERDPGRAP